MDIVQTKQPAAAVPQLGLGSTLWMFTWPALWYLFLIYGLGQLFLPASGTIPTWYFLFVLGMGPGVELIVGLVLLHREGYPLTLAGLRDRVRLRWPKGWKSWGLAVLLLILFILLNILITGPATKALAGVPGFVPPAWWPAFDNPTIQVNSVADAFPDVNMKGNFLFLVTYFVLGLVNIFGEEIYYRGYLLPRMHGVFGRWDWVANAVLFTLKHVYQRWVYPTTLGASLFWAFAFGPMGSLPLAMAYHWFGNFFLSLIMLVLAVLGFG